MATVFTKSGEFRKVGTFEKFAKKVEKEEAESSFPGPGIAISIEMMRRLIPAGFRFVPPDFERE